MDLPTCIVPDIETLKKADRLMSKSQILLSMLKTDRKAHCVVWVARRP